MPLDLRGEITDLNATYAPLGATIPLGLWIDPTLDASNADTQWHANVFASFDTDEDPLLSWVITVDDPQPTPDDDDTADGVDTDWTAITITVVTTGLAAGPYVWDLTDQDGATILGPYHLFVGGPTAP